MPLEILALMVVIGLALVIGAVHLSGGSKASEPMAETDAVNRFLTDFPAFEVSEIVLVNDGKIAFLASAQPGTVGMVEQMGRHRLTRMLDRRIVRAVEETGSKVSILLSDTTLPEIEFEVSDPETREKILRTLGEVQGE